MFQRRDHFKNDEIICNVEYQGEVKKMYTPQIEDAKAWDRYQGLFYIIRREKKRNRISEKYFNQ